MKRQRDTGKAGGDVWLSGCKSCVGGKVLLSSGKKIKGSGQSDKKTRI